MTELDYLSCIYELLQDLVPLAKMITGVIQFAIICFVIFVLYRLFKLFF